MTLLRAHVEMDMDGPFRFNWYRLLSSLSQLTPSANENHFALAFKDEPRLNHLAEGNEGHFNRLNHY